MKHAVLTSKRAQLLFIVLAVIEVLLISSMLVTVSEGQAASHKERHYTKQIDTVDNITSIITSSTITLLTQDNAGIAKTVPKIRKSLNKCGQDLKRLDNEQAKSTRPTRVPSLAVVINDLDDISSTIEAMVVHGDPVENAILMGNLNGVLLRIKPATEELRLDLSGKKTGFAREKDEKFGVLPWLLTASMIIPVIAAFYANLFAFGLSMRMRKIRESVMAISRGDQIYETMAGTDELSELHGTLRELSVAMDQARRKERAMIDNAGEIICSLDGSLRLSEVNPAVSKLGFTQDELLGTNVQSLIHPKDKEESHKHLESVKTGGPEATFEARLRMKDGNFVYTEWSANWSADNRSIFCVIHDITERKRAEQLKQDVLAMVSHDLRAPLTSIGVVLDMVAEGAAGELNERGERLVGRAQTAVSSLIAMIKDLLDIERAEAGGLALSMELTNARALIDRSLDVIRPEADRKKMALKVTCDDINFNCDSERISRVLVNLVNNALKFSPDGKNIYVVGKLLTHRNIPTEVEFQVIDEGPGIPSEKLDSIFEKFTQVGTGSEGEKMGSGLGLAICQTLVAAHNGKIGVKSTVGEGTTFWFRIPFTIATMFFIFWLGTFDFPGTAALAAPGANNHHSLGSAAARVESVNSESVASKQASTNRNSLSLNGSRKTPGNKRSPIQPAPGSTIQAGSGLRVLEPANLLPEANRPDSINTKRLYDYLLRFANAIAIFELGDFKKATSVCDSIMNDLEKSGDLQRSSKDSAQDNFGLMRVWGVTPLLRSPIRCGTVYARLYAEALELRGNMKRPSNPEGSLADLKRVVQMFPLYPQARVKLGETYLQLDKLDEAMAAANEAIKIDGTIHEAYFVRALVFQRRNEIKQQHACLEKANQLASQETVRLRKFVREHTEQREYGTLDPKVSARFIENNPRSSQPIAYHGDCLTNIGAFKEAQKMGAIAIALEPNEPYGYALKAFVERYSGNFETAIKDASEGIKLFEDYQDLYVERGLCYMSLGKFNEAIRDFTKLIKECQEEIASDPNDLETAEFCSDSCSNRSLCFFKQGYYKKAFDDALQAVNLAPNSAVAHNMLGVAMTGLGWFKESREEFEKAVALEKKYRGAVRSKLLVNLALQYQTIGNWDRAIKNYDLALLSEPNLAVKMFSEAAKAAQFGSRDSEITTALATGKLPGLRFVNQLELSHSRRLLQRTVAIAPRKREARYNHALASICLNLNKDAAEQLEMFLKSQSVWTERASVLLYLCRQRLGQEELAKQELKACLPKLRNPAIKALAKFFVGEGSESAIFSAASDPADSTLVNSYLGHYYKSKNDNAKAKTYIGATLKRGQRMTIEYVIALAELERLCGIEYDAKFLSR